MKHPQLSESELRWQFTMLPRLTTPRLLLRRASMRDARDMYAYAQDPEVARHVLWDAHLSLKDSRASLRGMIRQYRAGEPSTFAVVLRETDTMIGTIGFVSCSYEDNAV